MRKIRKDKGKKRDHYSSATRTIKKRKKCISLDKDLWIEVDLRAQERVQTRSELINDILRTILGSTESFIKYQLKEKAHQLNIAKLNAANYNDEEEIDKAIENMKISRRAGKQKL